MKEFLNSRKLYLKAVARETSKMSYPGRMGGIVKAGTKKAVEEFFVETFQLEAIWDEAPKLALRFEDWHAKEVKDLGRYLNDRNLVKRKQDKGEAVAAKFLNTYLYQLMKYDACRPLWKHLHLPLDKRVLAALVSLKRRMKSRSLSQVGDILNKPPYSITLPEYLRVQRALLGFIGELNNRPRSVVKLRSRIELNLLWAE
jgi:hypothetical protein